MNNPNSRTSEKLKMLEFAEIDYGDLQELIEDASSALVKRQSPDYKTI